MMKAKGYMGKLIRIDLTSGKIEAQDLDDETARMVIGGTGLAAKILWEETDAATDPSGAWEPYLFFYRSLYRHPGPHQRAAGNCEPIANDRDMG